MTGNFTNMDYLNIWKDVPFILTISMFLFISILAIFFEVKYIRETRKNKGLLERINNTNNRSNTNKK